MSNIVSFEVAKSLKERGFNSYCKHFYDKYGNILNLTPQDGYRDLSSYDGLIESYFTGEYNWNSLNVDEGMVTLKDAYENYDEYINCECSAPTIWEVVMWLWKTHKVWISVDMVFDEEGVGFWYCIRRGRLDDQAIDSDDYETVEDAYNQAILKVLKDKVIKDVI